MSIEELRDEARYARGRLDIYRAKVYGPRATSPVRLRELERLAAATQERLDVAERQLRSSGGADPTPPTPHSFS